MTLGQKEFYQAECLLWLSRNGHHLLFERESIIDILKEPITLFRKDLLCAEAIFEGLLKKTSINMKKEYLATLSEEQYQIFVRAYFHIIDYQLQNEQRLLN
jgi:hypothetical protein